jgi:hypothetical protein
MIDSAHLMETNSHQRRAFFECSGHVPYAHGAVVCRSLLIPRVHESTGTDWKTIAAVCITDLQNLSRYALALGNQ